MYVMLFKQVGGSGGGNNERVVLAAKRRAKVNKAKGVTYLIGREAADLSGSKPTSGGGGGCCPMLRTLPWYRMDAI